MTTFTAIAQTFTILGKEFDLDQLADIATHGCAAGVSGFIYSTELSDCYNANEETILNFLDEYAESLGDETGIQMVIDSLEDKNHWTMQYIKERAVWMYVELKAFTLCCQNGHPDYC